MDQLAILSFSSRWSARLKWERAVGTDKMLEGYGQNLVVVIAGLSCGCHELDDVVGSIGVTRLRDEE